MNDYSLLYHGLRMRTSDGRDQDDTNNTSILNQVAKTARNNKPTVQFSSYATKSIEIHPNKTHKSAASEWPLCLMSKDTFSSIPS